MKKLLLLLIVQVSIVFVSKAQIGKTFWFAAPEVTISHTGGDAAEIRISTFDSAATVRIYQPANVGGVDFTLNVPANSSVVQSLAGFADDVETRPFDQILSKGLLIESDVDITAYYEVIETNNTDIFALKSNNALGTEFYVPMQNIWPNQPFTGAGQTNAFSQFSIVATEDNTTIWILPSVGIFNHAAKVPFKITLNKGQSYSGRATGTAAALHPVGTIISSDKPVAVTYADDSVRPTGFGCYDLYGDQLVPTNIIGQEYIVNSNDSNLNPPELVIIVATQNNTQIQKNGIDKATLFNGQVLIDTVTSTSYYKGNKPYYLIQITGFGCEIGSAILPPLNCAGSDQVSFGRSSTTGLSFFLSILIRSGSEDGFSINGNTTLITAADFTPVPGTGGEWVTMFKSFTEAQIPRGAVQRVVNSKDVFSLGIVNGNTSGGTRFGYFSLFQSDIIVDAGVNQSVCTGNNVNLTGSVRGGAVTGKWSVLNGNGSFANANNLSTTYNPTPTDYATGSLSFVLESTGKCFTEYDTMRVNFTPGPIIDAGANVTICDNNSQISLDATYNSIVSGVQWSTIPANPSGFSPGATSDPATYQPTATQLNAGSFKIYARTVGVGSCSPVSDSLTVTVVKKPVVEAGPILSVCANNPTATLAGSVVAYSGGGQGVWTNKGNTVNPTDNALGGTYTLTPTEITNGGVTLTLSSVNNLLCNAESDNVTINVTPAPAVDGGVDQTKCANNSSVALNGSFSSPATGARWIGGTTSSFNPSRTSMNATYTPTSGEIASGSLVLTLESTGNGNCLAAVDPVSLTFTPAPTIDAGVNQTVCENNASATLNASFTNSAGVRWTNKSGSFNSTSNPVVYAPTNAEKTAGVATLFATTDGVGNCLEVTDSLVLTIVKSPIVEAGSALSSCANNPNVNLGGSVLTYQGVGTGIWSNGLGSIAPASDALTGVYTPTSSEIANGSVNLILASTNNGICNAVSDNVTLTIGTAPTVDAGVDQTKCANNPVIQLNGSFGAPATGVTWVGGTTSSFSPSRTAPNAVYTPTSGEIASGTLNLTLQTTGNGNCLSVSDNMTITFTSSPTIDAGVNQTVCENNASATLNASFTNSAGVRWTNKSGSFNSTSNPVVYAPTNAEKTAGVATLFATTDGVGNCLEVTDSLVLTIVKSPIVEAGSALSSCANNPNVNLGGSVLTYQGVGTGIWSNGLGSIAPASDALTGVYTPTSSEIANGSVNLILASTNNGICNAVSDNVTLTIGTAPTVDAGVDQTKCANNPVIQLNGSFGAPATGVTWVGGTTSSFSPSRTAPNAVYTPTSGEIASGTLNLTLQTTGNGNCLSVSDNMTITFTSSPTIDAGVNQTVCENNASATLNASFTNSAGVRWTNKSGSFNSTSNPVVYAPTNAEKTAGVATLFATTDGVGNCLEVTDSLVLTIVKSPIVEAGSALSSCANNPNVNLGGSVLTYQGVGTGIWSNGLGSIAPASDALTGVYTPTSSEIANGSVNLILASTNNGICNAVSDNVTLTIGTAPTVDAGVDQTKCANNPVIQLNGSFGAPATGVTWVGGTTSSFSPSRTAPNAVYTPTSGEIASGTLNLTLQTTGNGNCLSVSDNMTITFTSSPTIDAGVNQTVCENNASATLNASFTNSAGVRWTNKSGSFNSTSNPVVYAPTNAEKTAGVATLFATTDGVGNCLEVTDSLVLTIVKSPIVEAGSALSSCANNPNVNLGGSVLTYQGVGTGIWSNGLGSIAPASDALTGVYTPTSSEIANGSVNLILASTNNGICNAVSDNVTLTITPAPIVDAGGDQTICSNNTTIQLAGSATNGDARWVGGSGTFSPDRNTLNATYTPTPSEVNTGSLNLTLQSTNNGLCNAVTNTMTITFSASPTVDAGVNQVVCANNNISTLAATRSIATGVQWTGGAGTYTPNSFTDNITYKPTGAEITAGQVKLFATTTGVGNCLPVTDSVVISIAASPIVNAGTAITSCENKPEAQLVGSVTPYTGLGSGSWTGGAGSISPNSDALTGIYTPTATEISNGTVNLTLTSTNNGICNAVSDNVTLTIVDAPVVNAGTDKFVCGNNPNVSLSGTLSNASGARWVGGLGTFTPNRQALNAIYAPTQDEVNLGSINLTLESTGNGTCNAVQDQMTITFTSSPTVDAGNNQTVCANKPDVTLNGSFAVATGAFWNGFTGNIVSGSTTNMNAVYRPSASEIINGQAVVFLTTTGNGTCNTETDSMIVTITPAPTVEAGAAATVCANKATAQLMGDFTVAGGIEWSGGNGSYIPSKFSKEIDYIPTSSEIASGFVNLVLQTTDNGNCNAVNDNVLISITPKPSISAGVDQSICENNPATTLGASVSLASGVQWGGGLGTFSPDKQSLNVVYTPTPAEVNSGKVSVVVTSTGNGLCNAVTDTVAIVFTSQPVVEAGDNKTVCANNANTFLNGQVFIATGARWKNFSGSFSPNNTTLNASYLPSAQEITAGKAVLYLESTGNGNCSSVEDSVVITITPRPTVDAGASQTACANNSNLTLDGKFTVASGVVWSGGTGSFQPNNTDKNATYIPSTSEINSGAVNLTLTTTGNGNCFAVSDNVSLSISSAPTVNAGVDQVLCANNADVQLSGALTLATGGVWSGGAGSFTPNSSTLNAVYEPTPAELNAGLVQLTLTTTGNGSCKPESDEVTISFTPAPTIEAGATQTVCANNADVTLEGAVTIATGVKWFNYSGTFSTTDTDPKAVYTPSTSEIENGFVQLTLRSTGNGKCLEVRDELTINLSPQPFVEAGNDIFNCVDELDAKLNGLVLGATTTGRWTASGTGIFIPNATDLGATYRMSAQDSVSGQVTLTLTSTNNGNCIPVSDNVDVTLTNPGQAQAGPDLSSCANNSNITLNGQVSGGAIGGTWSSSGSGQFTPSATALNATYIPSIADTTAGSVTLSLTANSCDANTDQLTLTITDAPSVSAGNDKTVCADNLSIQLDGTVSGASTSGIWTSLGTGGFQPSNTSLKGNYLASTADVNNRSVQLILTSTNIGNCIAVSDTVKFTILPQGVVFAGSDVVTCANSSDIQLVGNISGGATKGKWSTSGTGTFFPADTLPQAIYRPSLTDKNNGGVKLKLTSNSCDVASDSIQVTITPAPTVVAGNDVTVCENKSTTPLSGQVTVATSGIWSSNGQGTFVSNTSLNTNYLPASTDSVVTVYLTSTGNGNCTPVVDSLELTVIDKPTVNAGIDQVLCDGIKKVNLKGAISKGTTSGQWFTLGTGGFDPSPVLLETSYLLSATDSANRGVTLILQSTNNGLCNAVTDTLMVSITDVGTADAGTNVTVCANDKDIDLNGTIQGGATSGTWTTSGSGIFLPNANSLVGTYIPSSQDSLNGTVTLTLVSNSCDGAKSDKVVTITPAPFVEAGPDQITCVDDLRISLDGLIAGASNTGKWVTSGTGSFIPNDQTLNASYQASKNDSINGSVTLTLIPSNIGNCAPISDGLKLTITSGGTANAGADQSVCSNTLGVQMAGSFTGGATVGTWTTSGNGSFVPNSTDMSARYIPSNQDIQNGLVTVTLETNSCDKARDNMVITIIPAPKVNAGNNLILCENNTDASLFGEVSGASGAVWSSTGSGAFLPSNTSLSANYKPSKADVANDNVRLYLTSIGNGNCTPVRDSIVISFTDAPKVDVGQDLKICKSSSRLDLSGVITGATSTGKWSTLGGGFFLPSDTVLSAEYVFGPADTANGFVNLVLVSTNNGNCKSEDDTLNIQLTTTTFADAGEDTEVCPENLSVQLNGKVASGASQGTWTTNGSGTFSPSPNVLFPTYRFSAEDSLNKSVQLILTANSGNGCNPGSDAITVRLSRTPTLDAGADINICPETDTIFFVGSQTNVFTQEWTSTGSGSFLSSSDTSLNVVYKLSTNDKSQSSISFVMSGESQFGCVAVKDTMKVNLIDAFDVKFETINQCVGDATVFIDSTETSLGEVTSW